MAISKSLLSVWQGGHDFEPRRTGHEHVTLLESFLQRPARGAPPASETRRLVDLDALDDRYDRDQPPVRGGQRHPLVPSTTSPAPVLLDRPAEGGGRSPEPSAAQPSPASAPPPPATALSGLGFRHARDLESRRRSAPVHAADPRRRRRADCCGVRQRLRRRRAITISIKLDLPFLTVALVQGDALGGGFEAVLSQRRAHRRARLPSSACRRSCSTCSRAWAPTACCAGGWMAPGAGADPERPALHRRGAASEMGLIDLVVAAGRGQGCGARAISTRKRAPPWRAQRAQPECAAAASRSATRS